MKKLKGFLQISRPANSLGGALAVILGAYVARNGVLVGEWGVVWLAALIPVLVNASSNAWNDCQDVEVDKINAPHRAIPAGVLSEREAWVFSVAMAVLSVILAAFVNLPCLLIAVGANLLLYAYSVFWKGTVLVGNVVVALISAMSVVVGGVVVGRVEPTMTLAVIIFGVILGREVLKDVGDFDGDAALGLRTVATVWGKDTGLKLFRTILFLVIIILSLPLDWGIVSRLYSWVVAVGVVPVFVCLMWVARPTSPPQRIETLSQILKYDMLVWFLAVWVSV